MARQVNVDTFDPSGMTAIPLAPLQGDTKGNAFTAMGIERTPAANTPSIKPAPSILPAWIVREAAHERRTRTTSDGDLVLVSTMSFPADVKRIEYYRDQRLFMLVYDDPEHEGDLMHYEIADDVARKVEGKSSMVVIEPDVRTGRPMGYYASLIQVGA